MKLESFDTNEKKRRWKIIRMDTFNDVPGEIVSADEALGRYQITVEGGETKTEDLGPGGIRLVLRERHGCISSF